eukprot:2928806-Prorocentrum_lima.AAC.1
MVDQGLLGCGPRLHGVEDVVCTQRDRQWVCLRGQLGAVLSIQLCSRNLRPHFLVHHARLSA